MIRDRDRSTIVKTRIIARQQQVVRVDRERITPPSPAVLRQVLGEIRRLAPEADAIIASDYAKGFLVQEIVDEVRDLAARGERILTVDPSPLNPRDWRGATAIKPNRSEALRAAGRMEGAAIDAESMAEVGRTLLDQWQTRIVLLTLGEEGMLLIERGSDAYHTPTRAREVFDVSGAGDTAISVFTVALAAGATAREAAEMANQASAIVVGKLGTATVTRDELIASFAGHREDGR